MDHLESQPKNKAINTLFTTIVCSHLLVITYQNDKMYPKVYRGMNVVPI